MSLGKVATREQDDREREKERKNETLFSCLDGEDEDGSTRISPCRHGFWGMGMYSYMYRYFSTKKAQEEGKRAISAHIGGKEGRIWIQTDLDLLHSASAADVQDHDYRTPDEEENKNKK